MLTHNGIIFAHHHLFSGIRAARVLFRGVVKARVGRADELDFDGGRLCHDLKLSNLNRKPLAMTVTAVKVKSATDVYDLFTLFCAR